MIFTDDYAGATIKTQTPILEWFNLFEPVELSYTLKPLIYELPCTWKVRPNFAMIFARATARPIQHVLGTSCNRANATILMQHT